jgi:hypothetical protein
MANLPEKAEWAAGILQLEINTPARGGAGGVMNEQAARLADRTQYLKKGLEAAEEEINGIQGKGGFINIHDFGDPGDTGLYPAPADFQAMLTAYALREVGITDPLEIFNGTKVTNAWDNHVWRLTNTPDTEPAVFDWADIGDIEIAIAREGRPGLVAPGAQVGVNPLTGEMYLEEGAYGGVLMESGGAMTGTLEDPAAAQVRNIAAGTEDMAAGTTELASGSIYLRYEA